MIWMKETKINICTKLSVQKNICTELESEKYWLRCDASN
jgi:hypothetical protein